MAVLGGTASQLMKLVGSFEYLFVDEAGQVTMELLAVLARKAQNLLLVPLELKIGRNVAIPLFVENHGCRWQWY